MNKYALNLNLSKLNKQLYIFSSMSWKFIMQIHLTERITLKCLTTLLLLLHSKYNAMIFYFPQASCVKSRPWNNSTSSQLSDTVCRKISFRPTHSSLFNNLSFSASQNYNFKNFTHSSRILAAQKKKITLQICSAYFITDATG